MPADVTERPRGPWTYERLARLTPEDNVRREIIDGWLYIDGQRSDDPFADVAAESSSAYHGRAVVELLLALGRYRERHTGQLFTAPMDVRFGDHVLQPDVFWLDRPDTPPDRPIGDLPRLVVEISSPSTRGHDLVRKRRVYEQSGVPEYWFVDLDGQRIEVYRLQNEGYGPPMIVERGQTITSSALRELTLDVDTVLGPEAR